MDDKSNFHFSNWKAFGATSSLNAVQNEEERQIHFRLNHCKCCSTHEDGSKCGELSCLSYFQLIANNPDFMRGALELYRAHHSFFVDVHLSNREKYEQLRERHEAELESLLETDKIDNIVVSPFITQNIFSRHQREMSELLTQSNDEEKQLEVALKTDFSAVLRASAALITGTKSFPTERPLSFSTTQETLDLNSPASTNVSLHTSDVPVRTVLLENPFWKDIDRTRLKPTERILQPLVIDVSPVNCLKECVGGNYDAENSLRSNAALAEHIKRLIRNQLSMLFLVGSETQAMSLIQSVPFCELVLEGKSYKDTFTPLAGHSVLKVLFNTRLQNANIILFFDTSAYYLADCPTLMEDVMRIAMSWGVDMLSIAILDRSYQRDVSMPAPNMDHVSFLQLQAELLKQLVDGLGKIVLEGFTSESPQMLQPGQFLGQSTEKFWWKQAKLQCPLSEGTSLGKAADPDDKHRPADAGCDNEATKNLRFNTPLAIRFFLPLKLDSFYLKKEGRIPSPIEASSSSAARHPFGNSFDLHPLVQDKATEGNALKEVFKYIFGDSAILC